MQMLRKILALSIAVLCMPFLQAADNPPGAERVATIKKIKAEAMKASTDLDAKVETVKSQAEAKRLQLAYVTTVKALLDRAVKLFQEVPNDAAAADAAFFVYEYGTEEQIESAATQILANNLNDSRLRSAIASAEGYGENALPFLKELVKKAPQKDEQALASFVLGRYFAEKSEMSGDKPEIAQKYGKLAEGHYEQAVAIKSDAKLGRNSTVGSAVKDELYTLQTLSIGKPAPDFEGVAFDGTKTKLSSLRGKVVVLDFWQTTCGPCLAMIPHTRTLVKELADKPFVFVGINLDANKATGRKFAAEKSFSWPQWWSHPEEGPADQYRVHFYPSIYVIDAKGRIRYKHLDHRTLAKKVEELVKEAEGK